LTDRIHAEAARCASWVMSPTESLYAIIPDDMPLSAICEVAELIFYESVRSPHPDDGSFLCVCWFLAAVNVNIKRMIHEILSCIPWDDDAVDYDIVG